MIDDQTRIEIATALEHLAAQETWNSEVWQRCFDLVSANASDDLVGYAEDDLIQYPGRRLFRSEPIPADFNQYRQEFRDIATALRERLSLGDYKRRYE